uniref:Protein TAP2 n=1 Tax=Antirrhinum majus TaxID=4151 RepID=TAP2_ANTMA|nr:RecName: Full=Protein TAP2; Flags: Precursor [Antirrhinum majus]CAA39078.1 tap2 [Antirrhinum majus]
MAKSSPTYTVLFLLGLLALSTATTTFQNEGQRSLIGQFNSRGTFKKIKNHPSESVQRSNEDFAMHKTKLKHKFVARSGGETDVKKMEGSMPDQGKTAGRDQQVTVQNIKEASKENVGGNTNDIYKSGGMHH